MRLINGLKLSIILVIAEQVSMLSYNRPKFCYNASWNANGQIVAGTFGIGPLRSQLSDIFIDTNDTMYVISQPPSPFSYTYPTGSISIKTIENAGANPISIFVATSNEIYVGTGGPASQIGKSVSTPPSFTQILDTCGECFDIFIDMYNNIYCSMTDSHKVIRKFLNDSSSIFTIAAGIGVPGGGSNTLNRPFGIALDYNNSLYVADCSNNRIQLFQFDQINANTVAGSTSTQVTIALSCPVDVVLDADSYLYIVEFNDDRLIGSGPYGFFCIANCEVLKGPIGHAFHSSRRLTFDSRGNMYVLESSSSRIKKYSLSTKLCNASSTYTTSNMLSTTTTSSMSTSDQTTAATIVRSYNRPKFSELSSWNSKAETFATTVQVGKSPNGIFINTNNTVYVANRDTSQVFLRLPGSTSWMSGYFPGLTNPYSLFVSTDGEIFIDNSRGGNQVSRWTWATTVSTSAMFVNDACYGLFIDIRDMVYCSLRNQHQVIGKLLEDNSSISTVIAGSGCKGTSSNMLNEPRGIFVDDSLVLYVADSLNNRIQKFSPGQSNGATAAGPALTGTYALRTPTCVVLDTDNLMFIVDSDNHRIVAQSSNGFRCIVGCSGKPGRNADQLNRPRTLSFDSDGNMFVVDSENQRIQKFTLLTTNIGSSIVPSYNQPTLNVSTAWNPNAITIADSGTFGGNVSGIFVTVNNTLYTFDQTTRRIFLFSSNGANLTQVHLTGFVLRASIFVTINGDIFMDNGGSSREVLKWSVNTNTSVSIMPTNDTCNGLFVDITNTLYCSMSNQHQVIKKPVDNTSNTTVAAGTGSSGSAPNMLNEPYGIFVDADLNLYVADSSNNRIQFYQLNQLNGTTLAGIGSIDDTITLNKPTGVILDGSNYLFIADCNNNRIIGSGPNGFRCIAGCSNIPGAASNQFNQPRTIAFDSYGNIFVADYGNSRIQKILLLNERLVTSYNQPKFCANAMWNSNANTFADRTKIGSNSRGIYIDKNNTVYVADYANNRTDIWINGMSTAMRTIYSGLASPHSIFSTFNGDIYIDNGATNGRVDKQTLNSNASIPVMYVPAPCDGLFVDISNMIYCSMAQRHQVIKKLLSDSSNATTIAAGTNVSGSTPDRLFSPRGIFVDNNSNLYVADYSNHRIQFFQPGESSGITIAGNGSSNNTITLNGPTEILLDGDNYIFIVDSGNNRIVRSGPNGFQCVVGCLNSSGSAANKLSNPQSMSFDSYGNLFVVDSQNIRIQKFDLLTASCACRAPTIVLTPNATSITSPVQYRRSQDFTIVSLIGLNCASSLTMTTQWAIINCTTSCSNRIPSNPAIVTKQSELYIPAKSLPYGLYKFTLTVAMSQMTTLSASLNIYVQIIPSTKTAYLIPYGMSLITRSYLQDLQLNPGNYSIDPDEDLFDATQWNYKYYCRIYNLYAFPSISGSFLTIDDLRNDSSNPSCLSNRTGWTFDNSLNSSFSILAGSLLPNRTYQFMVTMTYRSSSSITLTGYALVRIEDIYPYKILLGCVISTLCGPNVQFQVINPTTQVALFSTCAVNCTTIESITWTVYAGEMDLTTNVVVWALFDSTNAIDDSWFFGYDTSNFTTTNQLFLSNTQTYWRFEVVYQFTSSTSSNAIDFMINESPYDGSCSINPTGGTTSTVFTITCFDWIDNNGVKDYTVYAWASDSLTRMSIAYSSISTFNVLLPAGDNQTSTLVVIIHVRDQLNCIAEFNISSVTVAPDLVAINNLIVDIQNSSEAILANPIIQLLASENQNFVGQLLTSVSKQFNQFNSENLDQAISNNIPVTSIAISSFYSDDKQQITSIAPNQTELDEFNTQLNSRATARDYLIAFMTNLPITTLSNIELQASALAQLTKATNELTRTALTIASNRCYQLALALNSMRTSVAYEDIQLAVNNLFQCAANLISAVNGPLQERTTILNLDSYRATKLPDDYDTNVELDWANPNLFADGDDFSWETIQKNRNIYYQRNLAAQINNQMNVLTSSVTSSLTIHLNVGQDFSIRNQQVLISLKTKSSQSFLNKSEQIIEKGRVQLPNNFTEYLGTNEKVSLRSMMEPLASFGNSKSTSNTNLSRSISFSIFDQNQNEISIQTTNNQSIGIIIPRDPNLIIPSMILQNVTATNSTPNNLIFDLHYLNLTAVLPFSVHWEVQPLDTSLAYLFIYRFDQIPKLSSSVKQIDGWTLFCPENFTNSSVYTYYVDNQQTAGHQSVIFGLRQLDATEIIQHCSNISLTAPPITDHPINFTSDYRLRIYTSCCYYLDENQQWQSDGLIVGPLTNHDQTQCYSTHLTTFAGGFTILPET
ncbi:unnamed protein product, partial [Adineta ricciae]